MANDDKINSTTYDGIALRDGQPVGRRISSTAFPYPMIQTMTGNFGTGMINTIEFDINENNSTNPYLHVFHPKHEYDALASEPDKTGGLKFDRYIEMQFFRFRPQYQRTSSCLGQH